MSMNHTAEVNLLFNYACEIALAMGDKLPAAKHLVLSFMQAGLKFSPPRIAHPNDDEIEYWDIIAEAKDDSDFVELFGFPPMRESLAWVLYLLEEDDNGKRVEAVTVFERLLKERSTAQFFNLWEWEYDSKTDVAGSLKRSSLASAGLISGRYEKDNSVSMWVNPGDASPEQIKELFEAASALNVAFGGPGLVFRRDEGKKPITLCLQP